METTRHLQREVVFFQQLDYSFDSSRDEDKNGDNKGISRDKWLKKVDISSPLSLEKRREKVITRIRNSNTKATMAINQIPSSSQHMFRGDHNQLAKVVELSKELTTTSDISYNERTPIKKGSGGGGGHNLGGQGRGGGGGGCGVSKERG